MSIATLFSCLCISALVFRSAAQSSIVTGTAPGFAFGVTGGGDAAPVYPTTTEELIKYLTDPDPQNIVISGTFDFVGSEGTTTSPGCNAYSCTPDNGGQVILNTLGACDSLVSYDVELDTAGVEGINVASNKTLIGSGTDAVLNGKGLRFVDVSNIIVQNIEVSNINPSVVWGGDAFVLSSSSQIWIDHVTTKSLGRQHYSFGQKPNALITISNSFINGETDYSATCDGHTYWALELVGTDDQITFFQNYVHNTSGRSPALSGTTLFHAVNSIWDDNSGHAIEGTDSGMGLFEGCVFDNVLDIGGGDGFVGSLFSSPADDLDACTASLGRPCLVNINVDSSEFVHDDTDFFTNFSGLTIADVVAAADIQNTVPTSAGNTLPSST